MVFFKKSLKFVVAVELSALAVSFSLFVVVRRNESTRRMLYENLPYLAGFYYKTEDFISFGQLYGTHIKHRDLKRWYSTDVPEND